MACSGGGRNYSHDAKTEFSRRKITYLERYFQNINTKYVKIDKRISKRNNWILHDVLKKLIYIMKQKNKLFRHMRPRLVYIGSYYDGLRVGQPTEFDITIVLKLPIDYRGVKLDANTCPSGYTNIIMSREFEMLSTTPLTVDRGFQATETWCDKSNRLSTDKFRHWMQGVVDAALSSLPSDKNGCKLLKVKGYTYVIRILKHSTNGPANTILIDGKRLEEPISVDLVPTFEFRLPKRPYRNTFCFKKITKTNEKSYYAVPKPKDRNDVENFDWRLHFPRQEQLYMHDLNHMKGTLKLLKLLRDAQKFDPLASYYIKTIFLWECSKQPPEFWNKPLCLLVVHMLCVLRRHLHLEQIDNFWSPKLNLLKNIKSETLKNWTNKLDHIINHLYTDDRPNLGLYFSPE